MDSYLVKVNSSYINPSFYEYDTVIGYYEDIIKIPGVELVELDYELDVNNEIENEYYYNTTVTKCEENDKKGPLVAILDSGIDEFHDELVCNLDLVNARSFVDDMVSLVDNSSHGTHCAGVIIRNAVPNVRLLPLKIFGKKSTMSSLIHAIRYAIEMQVDIISASLTFKYNSDIIAELIQQNPNIMFVVAAGNYSNNNDLIPLYLSSYDFPNIISVAALNGTELASFSNYGNRTVDIAFPGVNILSSVVGNTLGTKSGTSMATPGIVGVLTHLIEQQVPKSKLPDALLSGVVNRGLFVRSRGWFDWGTYKHNIQIYDISNGYVVTSSKLAFILILVLFSLII